MLEFQGVTAYYSDPAFPAIQGIDMSVDQGEIVGLIGPNGAGKSTVLKTVFSLAKLKQGKLYLRGLDISSLPANTLARQGIAYVYQGRRLFPSLTVSENLEMGAYCRADSKQITEDRTRVLELFGELKGLERRKAGLLSGGEQQMVALGRALMLRPSVLLVDEPTIGLSPAAVERIVSVLRKISKDGVAILLVEQNVELALQTAGRAYIMRDGRIARESSTAILRDLEDLKAIYFGGYGEA